MDVRDFSIQVGLGICLIAGWACGFLLAPVDMHQGEVYRIIYLHVPAAFAAFASAFILLIFSLIGLRTKSEASLNWQRACAEVGLCLTIITLATGSIWGKPTWGIWWTWDARLTTTFLLALLYAGFLLLHQALEPGAGRVRVCSVLGILIAVDIPVIYKSVNWWRTLHQPHSIFPSGTDPEVVAQEAAGKMGPMDPTMRTILLINAAILIVYACWQIYLRKKNIVLGSDLEKASFEQVKA